MALRKQPRRWFFFAHDLVPPVEPIPTYRWSTRPLVYQAFPAFIEGRIPVDGWLDIVRGASSVSGEYAIDHGALIANDADGFFRALLANDETEWFLNRMGHFLLLSDQAIRDGLLPPRILIAGRCSDFQLLDDRKVQLDVEDIFAPYLDRSYPQYRWIDAYPFQPAPPPAEHFDEQAAWAFLGNTANLADTETVTIGANVYTFQTTLTNVAGHVHLGATLADSLSNLVAAITAGAGSGTDYAAATTAHPDVTAALSDAGANLGSLGSMRVTALVAGAEGNTIVTTTTAANAWWFNEGGVDSPTLMHGFVNTDINVTDPEVQPPSPLLSEVIPIYYGPHVQTKVDPVTLLPRQGICPGFFMGFTFLEAGGVGAFREPTAQELELMAPFLNEAGVNAWGEIGICAGELQVPNYYGSDRADEVAVEEGETAATPTSILLPEERFGVDALAPGHTGWPYATDSVMRNGFLVTVVYARGPLLWSHITGAVGITVDVCGWPDADGTPIDQAGFAWQDFMTQHVLANDGRGFTGGPLSGLPMFPPTVDIDRSMIWTSKIQDWQAVTAARLDTDKGYLISMGLTQPTTLREIIRQFNVTFDCFTAKNGAGQAYIFSINDLASVDDGVPIRERIELLNLPAPHIDHPAIENEITYTVGRDHVLQAPRTVPITIRDQYSISALKNDVRKVDGIRDLAFTADDATANDTMGRRLMRVRRAPRMQPLAMGTEAVDLEIGEQVRVTHQDGIGPAGIGYALRPMVVMRSVQRGDYITMDALDVGDILATIGHVGDDTMTDWASASDEERASVFFATADDGTVPPDDARGLEIR
jgi:hypothetical protein